MNAGQYHNLTVRLEGEADPAGWSWTMWQRDGSGFPKYADLLPHFCPFLNRLGRDGWELSHLSRISNEHRSDYRIGHLRRPAGELRHAWRYLAFDIWRVEEQWVVTAINHCATTTPLPWHLVHPRLIQRGWVMLSEPSWAEENTEPVEVIVKRQCQRW